MDAKKAIKAQFMKEYVKKDFTSIHVKSLCAATPVARTTFYFPNQWSKTTAFRR